MTLQTRQPGLLTERRYLVLFLPAWATDYLQRHEPELAGPLVLYERIKGGMRLAALNAQAIKAGLSLGQNLSDARAMLPSLAVREINRPFLEAVFADFADWHSNASPLVAVLTDTTAFGDLVLDITGVSHLFGGEQAMLDILLQRLRKLGYSVAGAITPTIGSAWALSHFAHGQVVQAHELAPALQGLTVAALRLSPHKIASLTQLGLRTIGQLRARDRKSLQARFGGALITRLDQAYGMAEERLSPRLPIVEHYVERRFADPIGLMDDVLMTVRDLAIQLAIRLEGQSLGAQAFHLFLYRVDHKVMALSVNSARITRDPHHISLLFANRSERLEGEYDAGFGVDMIRLAASSISQLDAHQLGVFTSQNDTEDLDRLYDRMSSRLGALAVLRTRFANSHIPERAVRLEPTIATSAEDKVLPDASLARPLRMLAQPEPITVLAQIPDAPPASMIWRRVSYVFVKASGPERISPEWGYANAQLQLAEKLQEDAQPPALELVTAPIMPIQVYREGDKTRDYYIAEDSGGRRFWIFREGLYGVALNPTWFMHGFFS